MSDMDDRGELKKAIDEARDILESVAAGNGFVIPFRAKEWIKKYGTLAK